MTTTAKSKLDKLKSWVVNLTGVLLVVPALINGGIDIYSSLQKLPKTESERLNVELFKKYFNKQPIAAFPVPIKQNNGTVEVKFSVYEEGDVFVEFGRYTQWFPFPSAANEAKVSSPHANFSLISNAIAAQSTAQAQAPQGFGPYQQTEQIQDGLVIRQRRYDNGVEERQVLDPRKGDILEYSTRRLPTNPPSLGGSNAAGTQARTTAPRQALTNVATIDLDALRKNRAQIQSHPAVQQQTSTASICTTPLGACQMLVGLPVNTKCACQGLSGPIAGLTK